MTEKTAPKHNEVTVLRDDANAYCRILTLLGMEEEGDPVAEVASLLADIEANAGLRAKVAQQAALVEKCMAAMNENADRGEKAEARLAALETHNTMLRACLKGVIRVADRKTEEFDAARAAIGAQPL